MTLPRSLRLYCCASLVFACAGGSGRAAERAANELSPYVEGANAFALELYSKLAGRPGSFFFSPFSVHTALAMAHAGARGATADAMAKTLHLPPGESTEIAVQGLMKALATSPERNRARPFELEIANALWSDRAYPLLGTFTARLKAGFLAEVREVDLAAARERACEAINGWVKDKTRGRIDEIVAPRALHELTRLILTNAIYFKSAWLERFSEGRTRNEPFFVSREVQANVPLMWQNEDFRYWETDSLQAVEVPYTDWALSMVLLVPRAVDGLAAVEKELSLASLSKGLAAARPRPVELWLPRFRTETTLSLRDALSELGLAAAFTPGADFSGMTAREELFIDSVLHKSYIAVDEEGTEAAAVTSVAVRAVAARVDEPAVVRADRPFFYAIRHQHTGAILFLGRFSGPAK